jgi:hypothetical protein
MADGKRVSPPRIWTCRPAESLPVNLAAREAPTAR